MASWNGTEFSRCAFSNPISASTVQSEPVAAWLRFQGSRTSVTNRMLQRRGGRRQRSVAMPSPACETPWLVSDVPEVIEVEPVVRRLAAVMRESIGIALGPPANIVFTSIL